MRVGEQKTITHTFPASAAFYPSTLRGARVACLQIRVQEVWAVEPVQVRGDAGRHTCRLSGVFLFPPVVAAPDSCPSLAAPAAVPGGLGSIARRRPALSVGIRGARPRGLHARASQMDDAWAAALGPGAIDGLADLREQLEAMVEDEAAAREQVLQLQALHDAGVAL